jgi:hypothetical protein
LRNLPVFTKKSWISVGLSDTNVFRGTALYRAHVHFFARRTTKMNDLTRPVTTRLDPELFGELQRAAQRDRLSMSDIVRLAVIDRVHADAPKVLRPVPA